MKQKAIYIGKSFEIGDVKVDTGILGIYSTGGEVFAPDNFNIPYFSVLKDDIKIIE